MNIINQETGEITSLQLQSLEIADLAKALAKAQGIMTPASKDGLNPHFRSSYATLDGIWQAARKPLADNGLSVVQSLLPDNILVTTLLHESGQWMRSYLKLNPTKNDLQGIGSALTYGRRYSLAAIVGISQADDDGEAASERAEPKVHKEKLPPQPSAWTPTKDEFFLEVKSQFGIDEVTTKQILRDAKYTGFAAEKAQEMYRAIEKEMRIREDAEKVKAQVAKQPIAA